MGTAGAPNSPIPEGPGQQRAAATRPQHSHTHALTSHGLGPTVGAGDLSWESALRATPSLGFLAQYGGAGEPDPPARLAKAREQQRGRLDGQTEGWTEPLVLGKLINRFVRGPLCGLGAKPRGQELVDWRGGSSLPSPGWGPPVQRPALSLGVVQTGAKVGRAGSRNVTISAVSR